MASGRRRAGEPQVGGECGDGRRGGDVRHGLAITAEFARGRVEREFTELLAGASEGRARRAALLGALGDGAVGELALEFGDVAAAPRAAGRDMS